MVKWHQVLLAICILLQFSCLLLVFFILLVIKEINEDNIGFLSYGSGSKSKILQGKIIPNWERKINHLNVLENINSRKIIDFKTYEKLHNGAINSPISNHSNIVLDSIDQRENKTGFRHYVKKLNEIRNRVAESGLITIDMKSFMGVQEREIIDISQWLHQGLVLKEKLFRKFLSDENG